MKNKELFELLESVGEGTHGNIDVAHEVNDFGESTYKVYTSSGSYFQSFIEKLEGRDDNPEVIDGVYYGFIGDLYDEFIRINEHEALEIVKTIKN